MVRRSFPFDDVWAPEPSWPEVGSDAPGLLALLCDGEMGPCRLTSIGSNYTFISWLVLDGRSCRVVYKPRDGEAPLWDFPDGTLYKREYAAYLLSQVLRWDFVPATVIRQGEHGVGSVQLYIPAEEGSNYFTVRQAYIREVQRIAVFDLIANNADRKGGHCFRGRDGRIWSIDHGLTFHQMPKLRTVIWDFAGDPIPDDLLVDLERLVQELESGGSRVGELYELLAPVEAAALRKRVDAVLMMRRFPAPRSYRDVPWPWV